MQSADFEILNISLDWHQDNENAEKEELSKLVDT
jgi:hypothetical protein